MIRLLSRYSIICNKIIYYIIIIIIMNAAAMIVCMTSYTSIRQHASRLPRWRHHARGLPGRSRLHALPPQAAQRAWHEHRYSWSAQTQLTGVRKDGVLAQHPP